MVPNTELENGKVELIREILDLKDIHDIDLLSEFNRELTNSLNVQNVEKDRSCENQNIEKNQIKGQGFFSFSCLIYKVELN